MTTILTETGWEDENGKSLGTWTNNADEVNEGDQIRVDTDVMPNTLGGDDTITGTGECVGIFRGTRTKPSSSAFFSSLVS